ncbi:MAG: bacillithiol biosynthesis deacetylase BshB1, partial [Acidobacteriia bacterium]|nr:bacillithiol biosynthesis deacetylase BshB1 [Terriglobia bacterium]
MKLDLLAIAPHPDDVELTCGGTMLKMAQAGYRTGILDLTQGEMGTRGTPETRLREAARAGKILGAKVRRNLGLPDAHLRVCDEYKTAIAEVIREFEPRTVILPYWEGRHPDHYTAATLGYEACFVAGLRNYPLAGEAFRPFKILYAAAYADVRPTFAVDNLARWCETELPLRFPGKTDLLIEADSGGSNGARCRVWKHLLQEKVADRFGLTITVCHYPTGCSKWNPIEH